MAPVQSVSDWHVQGREEDLRSVVTSLRATYGVDYIYCWHGLPAYWSGISLEVSALSAALADNKQPSSRVGS